MVVHRSGTQNGTVRMPPARLLICLTLLSLLPLGAFADEDSVAVTVTLKDHRWDPAEIDVPPAKRLVITIINQDATAEEFDSPALRAEKVIAGGGQAVIRVRPLDPGRYPFSGEYHADTAQGVVVAK